MEERPIAHDVDDRTELKDPVAVGPSRADRDRVSPVDGRDHAAAAPAAAAVPHLVHAIRSAAAGRRALVVAGPNVGDLFVAADGSLARIIDLVAAEHAARGAIVVVWSGRGARIVAGAHQQVAALQLPGPEVGPARAWSALRGQLQTLTMPVSLILDYADLVLPASQATPQPAGDIVELLDTVAAFPVDPSLSHHRLVLVARFDDLTPRVRDLPGFAFVDADLPDESSRRVAIDRMVAWNDRDPSRMGRFGAELAAGDVARQAAGLTNDDLHRLGVAAAADGRVIGSLDVLEAKRSRLGGAGTEHLDLLPEGGGFATVAGLPQVQLFLRRRGRSLSMPRAIVLAGPPGNGKTFVVAAMADELGWPAVSFGSFRSMWVGETERNLRRCLAAVRSLAPCVVHIDEADQVLGQRGVGPSGDGGVSERILAELWTFLGDSAANPNVLFVLTTNRPDLLDAATRSRAEVLPVLHLTGRERTEMLRLALVSRGVRFTSDVLHDVMSSVPRLLSGRAIVRAVDQALALAADEDGVVRIDHVRGAFDELIEDIDAIEDERMALKAIDLASFSSYLPWVAAHELGQEVVLPPYLEALVAADGSIDRPGLRERIEELDALAHERRIRVSV